LKPDYQYKGNQAMLLSYKALNLTKFFEELYMTISIDIRAT